MDARSIIARLRDRAPLAREELAWFANGLASGAVSDAQAGAFAMAALLNGLGDEGRVALTEAMRDSGDVLTWDLPGPVADKHSTGGIGDCTSLPLAPALAACGAFNPMISGRGLGHTGGTLDKLESIPGLSTALDEARLRGIVRETGCAIVSATGEIAPADRRLYAIRDVTATVESIDLITASILSKKLAAGLDALVLDVKCGSGAFMKTRADARALARALAGTANGAGCVASALITDMNQPLAPAMGNALEVAECMALLTGEAETADSPLARLVAALGGECLALAGLSESPGDGMDRIREAIAGGAAAERFGRMVDMLGGPADFIENWRRYLPEAPVMRDLGAPERGVIAAIDGEALGLAVVALGGGRLREGDVIDPAVGFSHVLPLGAKVGRGDPILRIHAADEAAAVRAERAALAAITIADAPPPPVPLVHERIT